MKIVVAKAVIAFQTMEEYNTILFQWYFKGFELLRRYMIKHGPGVDLENLVFEAVDKEMEEDEVAQASAQTVASTGVEPSQVDKDDGGAPQSKNNQIFFFFLGCSFCFWGFYFEQSTLYDMLVSLLDISLLLYF